MKVNKKLQSTTPKTVDDSKRLQSTTPNYSRRLQTQSKERRNKPKLTKNQRKGRKKQKAVNN